MDNSLLINIFMFNIKFINFYSNYFIIKIDIFLFKFIKVNLL
jgi:hypothetical protein